MKKLALSSLLVLVAEAVLVAAAAGSLGCAPASEGVIIQRGDIRVELPLPGERVFSEVLRADGTAETLDVTVDDDGAAHIEHQLDPAHAPEQTDRDETHQAAVTSSAASSSPTQCNDSAYSLLGSYWDTDLQWSFKASSTPSELTVDSAEAAVKKATDNILKGRNSCSLSDQISATATYLGRTTKATQVRSDGGCNHGDGYNVVNFGSLPNGVLGVTCTYSDSAGESYESDIKLNSGRFYWTTTATSASCEDEFDVESVVTHERGHTFGLGHVSDATHTNLTMSTAINGPCKKDESTLGKGDVLGLRELY